MTDEGKTAVSTSLFWQVIKYAGLFTIGGIGYGTLEILWRGYTHYSMLIAGGMVLCAAYFINSKNKKSSLILRALAVMLFIVTVELVFGLIFNILLGMRVWDYSDKPLNFFGQICLSYSFLWFILSFGLAFFMEKLTSK